MSYKKNKKYIIIVAPILILVWITFFSVWNLPEVVYFNDSVKQSEVTLPGTSIFNKIKYTKDKLEISFLGLIEVKSVAVQKINDLEVYPGGTSVGVKLSTEGVLVVGYSEIDVNGEKIGSPAKESGIELGDVILNVNGENIQSSKDLSQKISQLQDSKIEMMILREDKKITKNVVLIKEREQYKLGLWVRDSSAGIGTLSFYDKQSGYFGALGHPITDGDTSRVFSIKQGELLSSSIISVRKGEKGNPGELKGLFVNDKVNIGEINKNTKAGVFGRTKDDLSNDLFNKPIKVGFRNEIKEGPATIITTIDENGPKEYDIEIVKLLPQDEPGPKSMVIKVVDKELLDKTGGIVQGMSGSPIIQNKKIVGAVTHVLINKPEVGYGIYIEWMLKDAGVIN